MHWYETWLDTFKANPGFNDAAWVRIQRATGVHFECIGVHHLQPDENRGNHHVYLAVVGDDGSRVNGAHVEWGWEGMHGDEHTTPAPLDKPANEPWGNIPLGAGQVAWVAVFPKDGSDVVSNLTTAPVMDDVDGNTRFHHSYFVAFRHTAGGPVTPPDEPPDEPGEPPDVPGWPPGVLTVLTDIQHEIANGAQMIQNGQNRILEALEKVRSLLPD